MNHEFRTGNHNSASIELSVLKPHWADSRCQQFLSPIMMMTPLDAISSRNSTSVKMLSRSSFDPALAEEEWSRVRIVCRQAFNKKLQYGLSFIEFRGGPLRSIVESSPPSSKSTVLTASPPKSLRYSTHYR